MSNWKTAPVNISVVGVVKQDLVCSTAGTNRIAIPDGARDVTIINDTSSKVYVQGGSSTVTSDATGMPIPADSTGTFRILGATHLAGFTAGADATIEVVPGSGG